MLSEQLADAVATAGAALVAVHARPRLPATGVHWKDGVVVTTEGTIRREDDIEVTLPDGRHIPATLAGRDRGTDLAVLRIASGSLPVATLGDPATLRPGHLVLALARLDEGGPRAAFGAVSATGGKWRCWKGGEIDRWLQSDLEIYPGFGGGPLVDTASTASTACSTCWGAMSWERRCASSWSGQASPCRWTSSSASGHAERDDDHERSVPERPGGTAPGQCGRDRQWTAGSPCSRRGGHRLVRRLVRDQRARRHGPPLPRDPPAP